MLAAVVHRRLQSGDRQLLPRPNREWVVRFHRALRRMRWRRAGCALASVAVLGACGRDVAAVQSEPVSDQDILAISTPPDGSTTRLDRFDPDTLVARADGVDLGEYHDAWAFSPDRRTLAVGTFVRTGVRLIDVKTLRVVRDIPMPIAVEGVAWLTPNRLAVLLQRGGVLVVSARTGRIERRRSLSYRPSCQVQRQASTRHGAFFVVATAGSGAVRLIRVRDGAPVRVLNLRGLRAPSGRHTCGTAALAVAPDQQRALLIASGTIADVDLDTLAVRYRDAASLRGVLGQRGDCRRCVARWRAVWPTSGTAAVARTEVRESAGGRVSERARGSALIDTASWRARPLDPNAAEVMATSEGMLLTFGRSRPGLRATALDASPRWEILSGTRVRGVAIAGARAYVLADAPGIVRVLDLRTGALVASRSVALGRLDVLTGRSESGDALSSSDG